MGNAALRDVAVIESFDPSDLEGLTLAIDAHNWLYRYLTIVVRFTDTDVYTTAEGEEVANLIGIAQGIAKLLEHEVTPILVFDGGVTELKAEEVEQRREQRAAAEERMEAARDRGDVIEAARLESQSQRLTDVIHQTSRELLDRLDVPYIEAPAEGEAQAASMARRGTVDAAGTEDYDALLFGSPVTVRKLTTSDDPERMLFDATLERHDLTWEQLVDAAILIGTDFNEGLSGYGPTTAVEAVREHGDLWGVLETEEAYIEHADRIRTLFLNPDVTEDYQVDTDINPDFDGAWEYITDTWGIPGAEVERPFERMRSAVSQTGLDDWS